VPGRGPSTQPLRAFAILIAIAFALLVPAAAPAAVTVGSSLPAPTGDTLECADPGGCTIVPRTIAGTPVVVPSDGVIVRWEMRSLGFPDPLEMRVLRPAPGGQLTGVRTSAVFSTSSDGSVTGLRTNMPVQAGDLIGVDLDDGEQVAIHSHATFDSESSVFAPYLADGVTRAPTDTGADDFELLFNARIEPDADRDGYGDETQDRCPEAAPEHSHRCIGPRLLIGAPPLSPPPVVVAGEDFRLHVSLRNWDRSATYTNVVLGIALPPEVEAGVPPPPCRLESTRITCFLGTVTTGTEIGIDLPFRAGRPGTAKCVLDRRYPCAVIGAEANWGPPGTRPRSAHTEVRVLARGACANRLARYRTAEDRLVGTFAGDRMLGGARDDIFLGDAGNDCLFGRKGNDILRAGSGRDRLSGGPGLDAIYGDAGRDRLAGGAGRDRLDGGLGNDVVNAVDRKLDLVRCGPGRDRARVDAADSVAGCERVRRVGRA
jgi:hypothetical protein